MCSTNWKLKILIPRIKRCLIHICMRNKHTTCYTRTQIVDYISKSFETYWKYACWTCVHGYICQYLILVDVYDSVFTCFWRSYVVVLSSWNTYVSKSFHLIAWWLSVNIYGSMFFDLIKGLDIERNPCHLIPIIIYAFKSILKK